MRPGEDQPMATGHPIAHLPTSRSFVRVSMSLEVSFWSVTILMEMTVLRRHESPKGVA